MPAAPEVASRRVHPLVSIDYRIRLAAVALVALIMGTVFWERGLSGGWLAFLFVYGFVWPHLAFLNGT